MENQAKIRKPYTSDLTDAQWEIVQPLIPVWTVGGQGKPTCERYSTPYLRRDQWLCVEKSSSQAPKMKYCRQKERFGIIFIHGVATELGIKLWFGRRTGNTMLCGNRFVLPPVVSRRPAREAWIPKV